MPSRALPPGSYPVTRRAVDGTATVRENITVVTGTGASVSFVASDAAATLDRVEEVAAGINPSDVSSVESATILTESILDAIPVARTVTDVVLLAPGTTVGDTAFGNLASFGGATVGENAYYINGFNVTNFRNGLGGSTVPFEFYREFQVKTGGYGVEFGRATGGVINAITKRGTNEWKFAANAYFAPKGLQEDGYCVSRLDGTALTLACRDSASEVEANFSAAGPIIKDRLFFAGIYNVRNWDESLHAVGEYRDRKNDDPFWGVKLDWQITDNHLLEYTTFRDQRHIVDTNYLYEHESGSVGERVGSTELRRGGLNDIFRYTGYLVIASPCRCCCMARASSTVRTSAKATAARSSWTTAPAPRSGAAAGPTRFPAPPSTPARRTGWMPNGTSGNGCMAATACASAWIRKPTLPKTIASIPAACSGSIARPRACPPASRHASVCSATVAASRPNRVRSTSKTIGR